MSALSMLVSPTTAMVWPVPINPFLPDLVDAVNGREILRSGDIERVCTRGQMRALRVRSRPFSRGPIQMGDAELADLRVGMEVIQGSEAGDNRGQGSWECTDRWHWR